MKQHSSWTKLISHNNLGNKGKVYASVRWQSGGLGVKTPKGMRKVDSDRIKENIRSSVYGK